MKMELVNNKGETVQVNVTEKEADVIVNIAENNYNDWPLTNSVWSFAICSDGPREIPKDSVAGRVSSLTKKGLADSQKDREGDTTWLTDLGVQAYYEIKKPVTDKARALIDETYDDWAGKTVRDMWDHLGPKVPGLTYYEVCDIHEDYQKS